VQCWGNNGVGQLGKDTPAIAIGEGDTLTLSFTPVTVTGITTATAVAAGEGHTCALLANGTVQCWGDNQGGQLGNGTITRFHRSSSILVTTVTGITTATAIATGRSHTCALLTNGTVRCWGWNYSGQLGNGTNTNASTQVTVSGITTATAIAAGYAHTCAVLANGTVQCWGYGNAGQVWSGAIGNSSTPVQVSGLPSEGFLWPVGTKL